jgi:hypothetical protein
MKPNVLRAPLIKSAIVLILFSLLVYFTGTSPEGSVWASIGTIIIAAFRTVQWAVALAIGLAVCLAVLFGIFLGAVAMVNPASASRMYEGFRTPLLLWFAPIMNLFKSDREEKLAAALETFGRKIKEEISVEIQEVRTTLAKGQAELESRLTSLSSRLNSLGETVDALPGNDQVEAVNEEAKAATETVTAVQAAVDNLKTAVDQAVQQIQEISPDKILGDLPARIEALEQQEIPEPAPAVDIAPLEKSVADLQAELEATRKQAEEALKAATVKPEPSAPAAEKPAAAENKKASATKTKAKEKPAEKQKKTASSKKKEQEEEHRIFSYFDDPADKKKVADLVASTLKKDMSYKQVMDMLAKELGGEKGDVITSHPSLSKDYIRQCRRKS